METSDKMFVVVLVISIIFVGLFVYLMSIDRKTRRLTKELEKLEKGRTGPATT